MTPSNLLVSGLPDSTSEPNAGFESWSCCVVYGPTFLGLANCLKVLIVEASVSWAGVIDRDAAMGNYHKRCVG